MATLFAFILRAVIVVAGLIFAASLAVVFVLVLALWSLRALWSVLTGRPMTPFVVRVRPRDGFERVYRQASRRGAPPRQEAPARAHHVGDVTDVEPK